LCTMSTSRPVLREGEWACVDARCSYINTIHHSSCQACGRRKPRGKGTVGQAIGKDAAEKSKGLFEAEDWCCSKCGNINWARRATCNICNAKKFAEVEARTGYGGGYMDRQQVEYIPRNESEEEYDEVLNHIWLLKGKRKRTNEKHDSGYENLDEKKGKMENYDKERPDEEYKGHDMEREEEEEDDDDDEDGDLSKYQLGKYDFEKPLVGLLIFLSRIVMLTDCQSEEAATEVRRGGGGEAVGLMIVLHHHQDLDQARIPRLLETVPRAAINRTVGLQVPIGAVQLVHDVRLRLLREAEVVAVLVTTADLESIAIICIVAEKNLIAVANLPPIQVRPVEIRTGTVDIDDSDDAENEI
ncbi:Zinc finger Ran-binding domain-containing protein 2, partial [Trichinella sp. T8]